MEHLLANRTLGIQRYSPICRLRI